MQLEIRSKNFSMTGAIRSHIEKRLGFALDRFMNHVRSVLVWVGDVNGPKGGIDKSCRVAIEVGFRRVVLEERAPDLYRAITLAARRTRKAIAREVKREQTHSLPRALVAQLSNAQV